MGKYTTIMTVLTTSNHFTDLQCRVVPLLRERPFIKAKLVTRAIAETLMWTLMLRSFVTTTTPHLTLDIGSWTLEYLLVMDLKRLVVVVLGQPLMGVHEVDITVLLEYLGVGVSNRPAAAVRVRLILPEPVWRGKITFSLQSRRLSDPLKVLPKQVL